MYNSLLIVVNGFNIQERDFEKKVINYLKNKGFFHLNSLKNLSKRKGDTAEVFLLTNLETAIWKFNPEINDEILNKAILEIKNLQHSSLSVANKTAHYFLVNGIRIRNHQKSRWETVKIVDFANPENNEFIVTNQMLISSTHSEYEQQKPDIVIFLNGLPVVVFELKSPSQGEEVISRAFEQIQNYQKYLSPLFVFNVFNVISNKHINKYGTITSELARYSHWKDLEKKTTNSGSSQVFIDLLFEPKTFLNLLKNYVFFFDNGDQMSKIIAAYHQYYGVEATKKSVFQSLQNVASTNKKGGIFWHTQGSGKSFSMIMLVKNIVNVEKKLTTLVITDRKNLDNQIVNNFKKAGDYLQGQTIEQIESVNELSLKLKGLKQNGVYLCTVQKFTDRVGKLSSRNDILVITDEAHRSHRNIEAGVWKMFDDKTSKKESYIERYSYSYWLHQAFPLATFVGFTATPVESDDHSTQQVFGKCVSKYLISDAERDGCVVKISYESRQKKLHIDPKMVAFIDKEAKKIQDDIRKRAKIPDVTIKYFNRNIQKLENIIGDEDRVEAIIKDFIFHYQERKHILKGKAMFVCFNRNMALQYYKKLQQLAPELAKLARVIVTCNFQTDSKEVQQIIWPYSNYHAESASLFKDPDSNFKIAFVVDMWTTGFDVPCLDVVYIDKLIRKHTLMQTIARVNRVFIDPKNRELIKKTGLVVDYIGIWQKLKEALNIYAFYGKESVLNQIEDVQVAKQHLLKFLKVIFAKYHLQSLAVDYKKLIEVDKNYIYELVEDIQQEVIKLDKQQSFVKEVKNLEKIFYSVLAVLTKEERVKVQILVLAKTQLIKRDLGDVSALLKGEDYMKKIIAEAIKFNKTIVFDRLKEKPLTLTDVMDYLEKNPFHLKRKELEKSKQTFFLKEAISKFSKLNIVRGKKLSEKLKELLLKYDNNFITYEEWLDFFKEIVQEIKQNSKDITESGPELAFYEIISADPYSQSKHDKAKVKMITKEVFNRIRAKLKDCWFYNNEMKEDIKSEIAFSLLEHNYPPETSIKLKKKLSSQLEECVRMNINFN